MGRHEPWSEARTREIFPTYQSIEGRLLSILHALREVFGHVPAEPNFADGCAFSRKHQGDCASARVQAGV